MPTARGIIIASDGIVIEVYIENKEENFSCQGRL
jgi:hypothetical protein